MVSDSEIALLLTKELLGAVDFYSDELVKRVIFGNVSVQSC